MMLLFRDKYPPSTVLGSTADSFTDSFVAMFIFITSAENWNQIVYPMYEVSNASSAFFLSYVVFGTFVLTSLVIGTFEDTYTKRQAGIRKEKEEEEAASLCCSFMLGTWLDGFDPERQLDSQTFIELLCSYWRDRRVGCHPEVELSDQALKTAIEHLKELLISLEGDVTLRTSESDDGSMHEFERLLARMIFHFVDADHSDSVEFEEFKQVFAVVACIREIKRDIMLGHRVIAARWEIELRDAINTSDRDSKQRMCKKAQQDVIDKRSEIRNSRKIAGTVPWKDLNQVILLILLAHGYILALYATSFWDTHAYGFSCGFTAFYGAEIALRIKTSGGMGTYFNDSIRIFTAWSHRLQFTLVCLSLTAEIFFFALPAEYSFVCQAVMGMGLYRVLLLSDQFASLLHSLWHGLKPIGVYLQLFLLVYYLFSLVAWQLFDGVLDSSAANFNSLGDSMLLMFQLFVGEGWHEVMQVTTEKSNDAYMWFFMGYVLVVGILFSNLFIGIIIQTYQYTQSRRGTYVGQVDIVLDGQRISADRKDKLYTDLGYIAALLYNPVMHSLDGLSTLSHQFREIIQKKFGGNLEAWAIITIQKTFRRRSEARHSKFRLQLKSAIAELNKRPKLPSTPWFKITFDRVRQACDEAWDEHSTETDAGVCPLLQRKALAESVAKKLGAPVGCVAELEFNQNEYIRSWDKYTLMYWVIPPIISYFSLPLGRDLKRLVPRCRRRSFSQEQEARCVSRDDLVTTSMGAHVYAQRTNSTDQDLDHADPGQPIHRHGTAPDIGYRHSSSHWIGGARGRRRRSSTVHGDDGLFPIDSLCRYSTYIAGHV
eukprot:TRINITY_DN17678_c0_g1_i1.p1 TRINITY_DN17678_c0_g1~~TRINITY_DN17678_c0_g1_i1.p1  ORF type:complete len:825 (+),score=152.65 TRINITY_DN17678_c0_g1_i1:216-2690(+)